MFHKGYLEKLGSSLQTSDQTDYLTSLGEKLNSFTSIVPKTLESTNLLERSVPSAKFREPGEMESGIETLLPGLKAIRESIEQRSYEPLRGHLATLGKPAKTPEEIMNLALGMGLTAPIKKIPAFGGFKDLTTKFLDYAKGKTTLSKQEIMDFAKRPELKKGEVDLLNNLAKDLPEGKFPAQGVTDSIHRELLELKPVKVKEPQFERTTLDYLERYAERGRKPFKGETLGKNYEEVVFESPIATNGSSHYQNSKNYFAHARGDEVVEGGKKIWREQEIQSDLLQKDNLERLKFPMKPSGTDFSHTFDPLYKTIVENADVKSIIKEYKLSSANIKILKSDLLENVKDKTFTAKQAKKADALFSELEKIKAPTTPIDQLQPFTNDRFGERIMRERIKDKAQAGYEKYRLPTGETIGKIEGFQTTNWLDRPMSQAGLPQQILQSQLEVGKTLYRGGLTSDAWIITDILGDGRFAAMPKKTLEQMQMDVKSGFLGSATAKDRIRTQSETFDLTGKSNPQYRRYSDWGKFLKNKFGGKEVTDPQGNSWMEIDLKKEQGKLPIEAFGAVPFLMPQEDENK